jgi:hypothetical protein
MVHTISSMHDDDDDVSTLKLEVANSDGCHHALLLSS